MNPWTPPALDAFTPEGRRSAVSRARYLAHAILGGETTSDERSEAIGLVELEASDPRRMAYDAVMETHALLSIY